MKRRSAFPAAVSALLLASAIPAQAAWQPAQAPGPQGRPDVVAVEADDPAMTAARLRARAELPAFFRRVARPGAGESHFSVKFDLGGTAEFIWAGELRHENGVLTGTLSNDPVHEDYEEGQRVTIAESAIIDWGYLRGQVMQGNYTTRALLDRMDPREAAAVRHAYGW